MIEEGTTVGEDQFVTMMENDQLTFQINQGTTDIKVIDKRTGYVWSSEGNFDGQKIQGEVLNLSYYDNSGSVTEIDSYTECVAKGQYAITQPQSNQVKVQYSIGTINKLWLCPVAMSPERYQTFYSKMTPEQQLIMDSYYYLVDFESENWKARPPEEQADGRVEYPLARNHPWYYPTPNLNDDGRKIIHEIMKNHIDTIMPGFTHLQKAQPITLAHHMGAYFEMFKRDRSRLHDIYQRMNYCPLGSGALAGTTYPLDREYSAKLLGFDGPCLNSIDGVSDRDYLIELLSAMSTMMMHMSRLAEEMIIWNSNEYQFIELDDTFSTGSSIMPQKKNPDICELIRGKTGRVYGALMGFLTTMKGIPLAYNKDMQEDKEMYFDALNTTKGCLQLLSDMLKTTTFNKARMKASATGGFTNATDAADYLVNKGVPFRDAHGIIGQLVLYAIEQNKALDELTLEEYQKISDKFDQDIYEAIDVYTCVNKRNTIGACGQDAMKQVISLNEQYLNNV